MTGRIIRTADCVAEGAAWLAVKEPRFARILPLISPLPLRREAEGFDRLLNAIVGQQVSVASARAIWGRLDAAGLTMPGPVRMATEVDLRGCGLSRQKIKYAKALAEADIDYAALNLQPTSQVIETLVKVPGIGLWTAEIYVMFSLGRADVFAAGDLALAEAARLIFDLPERPKDRALRALAENWSPWRAVAARLLWAYYKHAKDKDGIR
jgi:DNA-3-methyladenine glycosylase II